jgi:hypothetical protein
MSLEKETALINIIFASWEEDEHPTTYVFALKLKNEPWWTDDINYDSLSQLAEKVIERIKDNIEYNVISNHVFPEINNRYFNGEIISNVNKGIYKVDLRNLTENEINDAKKEIAIGLKNRRKTG